MQGLWWTIAILLIGVVLGTGFGVALGFFLFPFVFPPPPATDTVTDAGRVDVKTVARPCNAGGGYIYDHDPPSSRVSSPLGALRRERP
jgi:hypothetical protein